MKRPLCQVARPDEALSLCGVRKQIDFRMECRLYFVMEDPPLAFSSQAVEEFRQSFDAGACEVDASANLDLAI